MNHLPIGTVTFLFTDMEGSTRLLESLGPRYHELQRDHARILREAITTGGGTEISTEGDSFFAVFPTSAGAVNAAVTAQRALASHSWPDDRLVRVRMGIHTGEAVLEGGLYLGIDVNRAARIAAAGHGGQVVVSEATRSLIDRAMPAGTHLRDLGDHRLKDLAHPERLHQLVIEGLPEEFPPLKTVDARPNNLPEQLTSFVGRQDELAAVRRALEQRRLVTLTGPGGSGKTRLAIQAAGEILTGFADGALFVDLSPLADPDLVPAAIAEALGVRETPEQPVLDRVAAHLRDQEVLLVLDNFEQVTEAAPVVERLLRDCPRAKVLVTSRVVLHLYGEYELEVPPLALPNLERLPAPDELSRYDAVALFAERAGAARPGLVLTDDNARAVAAIAVRLDGLPLAIELAASRVTVLSPEAILQRLEGRLTLLASTARNLPERQRTLRGAIAWSHDLLAEQERRLFARLGVFVGGASLDAIEAVCNPATEVGLDTLDGVSSLVDKSLLRRAEGGAESRFAMLETIREFAVERLVVSGERDLLYGRHAQHLIGLAAQSSQHLRGPDQTSWTARLNRDLDNFRAVLTWTMEAGEPLIGLRLAAELREFWRTSGHYGEGRRWLAQLLAMPGAELRTSERARALVAAADLSGWIGDLEGYMPFAAEALEIFREIGDRAGTADALEEVGAAAMLSGDLQTARKGWQDSRDIQLELDNRHKAAEAIMGVGMVDILAGEHQAAIDSLEESTRRFQQLGDRFWVAFAGRFLGVAHRFAGDRGAARRLYSESLGIFHQLGALVEQALVLDSFADLALVEGNPERAMRLAGAADALRERSESVGFDVWIKDPKEQARAALGAAADRLYAEGHDMDPGEAVAYTLKSDDG